MIIGLLHSHLSGKDQMISMRTIITLNTVSLLLVCIFSYDGPDGTPSDPRSIKTTYMVEMEDGILLATDVHSPDAGGPRGSILVRTPYDRTRSGLYASWTNAGWNGIAQDIRGSYASEGESQFPLFWDAPSDGNDTVNWIADQSWSDGKVATYGGSALGVAQYFMAGQGPDNLTCQFITQAPPDMYHYSGFQGGEFKPLNLGALMVDIDPDEKERVYDNENFSRAFWGDISLLDKWSKVDVPALHAGGWWDGFSEGIIDGYLGYNYGGGDGARNRSKLVMGPWTHGDITYRTKFGEVQYPADSIGDFTEYMFRDMLEQYMLGTTKDFDSWPDVTYYTMGDADDPDAPGMEWRYSDVWPVPANYTSLYLQPGGVLDPRSPRNANGSSTYSYDPSDPVPTKGGQNLGSNAGPYDQRPVETRNDVLLFETKVLEEPVEATGKIRAKLYVSSDREDTDFTVKLTDVYPDGRSMLVADGIIRMRNRNGDDHWEFMEPGKVYGVDVDLWSTSYIWNAGHRIRAAISSSNYPRFVANPNTRDALYENSGYLIAHNSIHFDRTRPSALILPIVGQYPNELPLVEGTPPPGDIWLDDSSSVNLTVMVWDEDQINVSFLWKLDGKSLSGTNRTWFEYSAVGEGDATHSLSITAIDPRNSSMRVTVEWTLHVRNVDDDLEILSFSPDDPVMLYERPDGFELFSIDVYDEDPYEDEYDWYLNGANVQHEGNEYILRYDMGSAGLNHLRVTVHDAFDSISKDWEIRIMEVNRPPEMTDLVPLPGFIILNEAENGSLEFTIEASDPDGDKIDIGWFLNGSEVGKGNRYLLEYNYNSSGFYMIEVRANDGKNITSAIWHIRITDVNRPPIFIAFSPPERSFTVPEVEKGYISFSVTPIDPDGDDVEISWIVDERSLDLNRTTISFSYDHTSSGYHSITATADDGDRSTMISWVVRIVDINRPPVFSSIDPKNDTVNVSSEFIILTVIASDPDGDPLTFRWSSGGPILSEGSDKSSYNLSRDDVPDDGQISIKVEVDDGKGGSIDHTWELIFPPDQNHTKPPPDNGTDERDEDAYREVLILSSLILVAVTMACILFFLLISNKRKRSLNVPNNKLNNNEE
jgi:predicted acyl esterase